MGVKVGLAAATIVILLGGALWLLGHEDPASILPTELPLTVEPSPPSVIVAPTQAPATAAEARATAPERETVPPPDRENDLHGRVIGERTRPVRGAKIEIWCEEFGSYSTPQRNQQPERVATTLTDARGEFRVRLPRCRPFRLQASAAGYAPIAREYCYAGEYALIELERGAVLRGTVKRSRAGSGVAGAEVRVVTTSSAMPPWVATSDAQGVYHVEGLPPGVLLIQALPVAEAPSETLSLELSAGARVERDLIVGDGLVVTGVVKDADSGEPIAGATVESAQRRTTTDAAGRYVLRGLRDHVDRLVVSASGHGRRELMLESLPPESSPITFLLLRAKCARGRVRSASGQPIKGALVAATASGASGGTFHYDWSATQTDDEGAFDLRDLRPDLRHVLFARKAGFGSLLYDFPQSETREAVIELDELTMHGAAIIAGTVSEAGGSLIADASLTLTGWNADRLRFAETSLPIDCGYLASLQGRTDDLGRFGFTDLAPGTYRLELWFAGRPDKVERTFTVGAGERREHESVLAPGGLAISGQVTDPDGVPVRHVDLSLFAETTQFTGGPSIVGKTDGTFRFAGSRPGPTRCTWGRCGAACASGWCPCT
ncbi:MAG: carboxypeptidase regulatory-like domain-containing protein [Planctomycetota bacterium]